MKHLTPSHSMFAGGLVAALTMFGNFAQAADDFARATPHGKAGCPAGTFLDIGRGDCWSCPKNTKRTVLHAVDSANACEGPASTDYEKADRHGRGTGLLKTDCARGQFWDPNGYCYTCPRGYDRTVFPVTGSQACSKPVAAVYARATRAGDFCPRGSFLDIGRGDCWSCPDNWYRTVNAVTSARACASKVGNIFAGDTGAMCGQVIAALREGEKGAARFFSSIEKVIAPVMGPVNDGMRRMSDQLRTPELDRMIDNLAKSLHPHGDVIDELQRLSVQLDKSGGQLQDLLLNPRLVCEGNLAGLDQRLIALGLRPNLGTRKSGVLDDLLIRNAYAAEKGVYSAFSLTVIAGKSGNLKLNFGFTLVTNFAGTGRVYFSIGLFATTPELKEFGVVSVGVYIFPSATIDDFDGMGALSSELSLGLIKKAGRAKVLIPDNISISFDPGFLLNPAGGISSPGYGASKDLLKYKGANTAVEVGGSIDFSVDSSFELGRW